MSPKMVEQDPKVEVAWTPSGARSIPSGGAVAAIISRPRWE